MNKLLGLLIVAWVVAYLSVSAVCGLLTWCEPTQVWFLVVPAPGGSIVVHWSARSAGATHSNGSGILWQVGFRSGYGLWFDGRYP